MQQLLPERERVKDLPQPPVEPTAPGLGVSPEVIDDAD